MEPAEAAVDIRKAVFRVRRPIPAVQVKKLWQERLILARCRRLRDDVSLPAELRDFCCAAYDSLSSDTFVDFDPDDAAAEAKLRQYFGALIMAGAMTEQDQSDTLALAEVDLTGAALFGDINESDIKNAGR
jgi:hypothetical protein